MADDISAHPGASGLPGSGAMLTRRQALRAGALAGAVVWTAPAVQALTMSPAAADSTSVPRRSNPKPPNPPPNNPPTGGPRPPVTPDPAKGKPFGGD